MNSTPSSTITTTSSRSSSSSSTTQACAACKYQRRKCNPNCILAPYFPADCQRQFLNAHRLFGVSNILKIIRGLDPHRQSEAMKSIKIQADMRAHDPVGGCYRLIVQLEREYEHYCQELAIVLHQLALCRQAAAAAQVSQDQPPILGDADQINAVNPDDAIYGSNMMIAQQQQQQQYLDYFYFGNNGSGGGENNIENEDHININIHNNNDNAAISSNSVNNNNIGINGGNAATNEMDMEVPQSMFALNAQQQEDDVKPLIDMFDVTHALAIGDEEEVGEITSKAADLDLGSYHCRSELGLRHNFHSALNVTYVLFLEAI